MQYDHTITLLVPVTDVQLAKLINQHLDQDDVGGAGGFTQRVTKDSIEYAVYSRPCDSTYANNAAMLLTIGQELFDMCQADSRFETKPTIEECEQFCLIAEAYVDSPLPPEYEPLIPESLI